MSLPSGFDLKAIEVFVYTVEAGGMTQAAKRLKLTQSGVSQVIKNLERSLDAELFDRSMRPMTLTPAGTALYGEGRRLLAASSKVFQEVAGRSHRTLPAVTVAMAESVANTVGASLVGRLRKLARRWTVWSGISPDHHAALLGRDVDIAITASHELDADERFESYPILTEPFVLALPWVYAGPVDDLDDVAELPMIRYALRSVIGQQIEGQLKRLRLDLPIEMEFDSASCQVAAVASGMGWSLTTPLCLIQESARLERIRVAPMPKGAFSRTIRLVARKDDLGQVPVLVARECAAILRTEVYPRFLSQHEWVSRHLIWYDDRIDASEAL